MSVDSRHSQRRWSLSVAPRSHSDSSVYCSCITVWGLRRRIKASWSFSILSWTLTFGFIDTWDGLVSKVYYISNLPRTLCLRDLLTLPGEKQWTSEYGIIFEEDNNTNSCIWVDIISLPRKFQRILVIWPFRTSQDPTFEAKLQRKLITWKFMKEITLCCQQLFSHPLLGNRTAWPAVQRQKRVF